MTVLYLNSFGISVYIILPYNVISHCLHFHICNVNANNRGHSVFDPYSCLLPGADVACLYWAVALCIPVWIQMYMYILELLTGEGSTLYHYMLAGCVYKTSKWIGFL